MKKIVFSIILVLSVLFNTICGFTDVEQYKKEKTLHNIKFTVGSDTCYVNGEIQKLEQAIYIDEATGKAMLPIKSFCDIYGCELSESRWYNNAGIEYDIAEVKRDELTLELYLTDSSLEEKVAADDSVKDWTTSSDKFCTETYIYTQKLNNYRFVSLRFLAELFGFEVIWNDSEQTITLNEKTDDELFEYMTEVSYQQYDGTLTISRELINRTPYYLSHWRGSRPFVYIYENVNGEKGNCIYPIKDTLETGVVDGKIISSNSTEREKTSYTNLNLPKGNYICEVTGYERIVYAGLRLAEIRGSEYKFEVK